MNELEGKSLLEYLNPGVFYVDLDGQLVEVILYSDLERGVNAMIESSSKSTCALGARKITEYNGFTVCSNCRSRIFNPSEANFCSNCGRKFINVGGSTK